MSFGDPESGLCGKCMVSCHASIYCVCAGLGQPPSIAGVTLQAPTIPSPMTVS